MKKFFLILTIVVSLDANIDFSKYINPQEGDIALSVKGVKSNDVLNLRLKPSSKSKIIYKIPYDAKNLTTYDKDIIKKLGTTKWVPVKISFIEGYFNGWVKGKFLKLYEKYSAISSDDLLVIYPSFLVAKKSENNWIKILDTIEFEHYSRCDERSNPKLLDEFNRFDLRLKVYYSLLDAFVDNNFDNYKEITKNGWFKGENEIFKKINYFGLKGYVNRIGVEGCGINSYIFKINGKILVIQEPFNKNLPIVKNQKELPKNLELPDKKEIIKYIIKNLRLF
jgi:hypothetical protein